MTLPDSLHQLFVIVSGWNEHAHGFGLFLLLPIAIVTLADGRVRETP